MRRVLLLFGFLAVGIAAIAVALPLFVTSETVRTTIKSQLQDLTGREVSFRGNPKLSLSPFLAIQISDLLINDPMASENDPPLLEVDQVQAKINFVQALFGNIRFDEYKFVRPRLNMKTYANGRSNWVFEKGALLQAFKSSKEALANPEERVPIMDADLGVFAVVDGAINYENVTTGVKRSFTAVEGTIDWPNAQSQASISGNAIWRGESLSMSTSLRNPIQLLAGGESNISVTLESTPLNIEFSGLANMISDLFIAGEGTLSTPSTKRLSEIFETNLGNVGSFSVSGEFEATPKALRFAEAAVVVSENAARGAISFNRDEDGIPNLDGTLAFGEIDFSNFVTGGAGDAAAAEISENASNVNVDLRLSASAINVGFSEISDVAAIVSTDENGWLLDIGQATAFGGNLIAKLGERTENERTSAFLDTSVSSLNTEEVSALFSEHRIRFSGPANLTLNIRGDTIESLLSRKKISGDLKAEFLNGAIEGIDLDTLLSSTDPVNNALQTGSGLGERTEFESARATLFVTDGIGNIGQSEVNLGERKIQISGSISLDAGSLSLRAQELTDEGPQAERLFIGGTFRFPLVSVKPLIKTRTEIAPTLAGVPVAN